MPLPVLQRRGVGGVGVAVVAEVWAGIVFADVLGHNATASEALSGIFLVSAGFPFVGYAEERIARDKLRSDELHELGVV